MCRLIRTGCGSGGVLFLRRRFGHAARAQGVRPLPRSRGAFSPVSSNRPDLRGIHADFDCHSISCCPVASGRQSRGLLQRARHSKNAKRDAVCLMAFFVSLLQRQGASARREMISYRFIMLHRGDGKHSCGVVFLSVFFFSDEWAHLSHCSRRSSLTYSALTYFAQRITSRQAGRSCPVRRASPNTRAS